MFNIDMHYKSMADISIGQAFNIKPEKKGASKEGRRHSRKGIKEVDKKIRKKGAKEGRNFPMRSACILYFNWIKKKNTRQKEEGKKVSKKEERKDKTNYKMGNKV